MHKSNYIVHMNYFKLLFILLIALSWAGCTSEDEFVNQEADVLQLVLPDSVLQATPIITNTDIFVYYITEKLPADGKLVPHIQLTDGAFMRPQIDTIQFVPKMKNISFEVVAQDTSYVKGYTIHFLPGIPLQLKHKFDDWATGAMPKLTDPIWATGNLPISTINLLGSPKPKPALGYPTKKTDDSRSGFAAELISLRCPSKTILGKRLPPLIPGALYMGSFELIMDNPIAGTKFGHLFDKKADVVTGYYKYKGSDDIVTPDGVVMSPNFKDSCSMEVYFYDAGVDGKLVLDGTNIKGAPQIIAEGKLVKGDTQGDGFERFEMKLIYYRQPNFAKSKYKLAVSFAASHLGDKEIGGNGSRMVVDDVEIVVK